MKKYACYGGLSKVWDFLHEHLDIRRPLDSPLPGNTDESIRYTYYKPRTLKSKPECMHNKVSNPSEIPRVKCPLYFSITSGLPLDEFLRREFKED